MSQASDAKEKNDYKMKDDEKKDVEETKNEMKLLEEVPGLGRSPSMLQLIQEAGSDARTSRAEYENAVRLLPSTDGARSTHVNTTAPQAENVLAQVSPPNVQGGETVAPTSSRADPILNEPVEAPREVDQSPLDSINLGEDEEDIVAVRAPSWSSQLTQTALRDLARHFGANETLYVEMSPDDDSATAFTLAPTATDIIRAVMQDVSNHPPGRVEPEIDPEILARTEGLSIITVSPYRNNAQTQQLTGEELGQEKFEFSKQLMIEMKHDKHDLEIDLFRPQGSEHIFPSYALSPLSLYRQLRTLKVVGMMQCYQSYIWEAVWLNPNLTELTLEMANEGETIDTEAVRKARKYAKARPSMSEVVLGKSEAATPEHLPIAKLRLAGFTVGMVFFKSFDPAVLREVELHQCKCAKDLQNRLEALGLCNTKVSVVELEDWEDLAKDVQAIRLGDA